MATAEYTVRDILTAISRAFGRVATELGPAGGPPAYLLVLLRRLGWNVPLDTTVRGAATTAIHAAAAIEEILAEEDPDLVALASAISGAISSMVTVSQELDLVLSDEFLAELESELPTQLLDFLIIRFLETEHPRINALLTALGVLDSGYLVPESPHRIPYVKKEVRWNVLRGLVTAPAQFATQAFGWGTPDFNGSRLVGAVELICAAFQIETSRFVPTRNVTGVPALGTDALFFEFLEWPELSIGAELYSVRNDADDADIGFALAPYLASQAELELPLTDSLSVGVQGALQLRREIGLEVTPNGLRVFGVGAPPPPTGQVKLSLLIAPPDGILTIGNPAATHFSIPKCRVRIPINIVAGQVDLGLEVVLEQTELVIASSGADSFVGKILGDNRIEGRFELGLGIDRVRGLYLIGSGGFETEIPLHRSIGPLTIESIFVGVALDGGRVILSLAASISAQIGPVAAAVTHVGVEIVTDTANDPDADLELGPLHLSANFLPPTGGGLALAAGPITGGGFIKHDAGTYSGILDLKFSEIGLVAVGIITTKPGFALFINIGVTFSPPITLPYNFTLQGCGGLCAVNRTMDTEALRSGLRNKTLDSILFPADPIKNASKIISDSERVFPIEEGRFVIGPMAKLGWGTGGLLTANLAIVLELPDPFVIALLGQIKVRVPQDEEAKVKLNLDFLGVLEIEKKSLSFDATLYDSKVLIYDLSGDSALRVRWGSSPQFAMSVGGFHPKFTPPANFPSLRRLTLSLRSSSSFELSCTMYHALTSNTLQFGARLRIFAAACGAEVEGHLSFDTLFQFSPFEFEVNISGGLSASFHGHNIASVKLDLDLSGPTPWHAKGKAKVSVLCWDTTARFNKTWGSDDKARVAKIDPLQPFLDELAVVGNWGAALSPRRAIVETLKSLEAPPPPPPPADSTSAPAASTAPDFLVHPAGALSFRQRLLPLDMKLDKFKNVDVKTHFKFDVRMDLGAVAAPPAPSTTQPCLPPGIELIESEVQEHFAKGQFKSISKADRLSRPSYEKFRAGLETGPALARVDGCVQECELEYESILIMPEGTREQTKAPSRNWAMMKRALAIAAMRRASMRHQRRGKFGVGGPGRVGMKDEAYAIVDKATLARVTQVQPLDAPRINQTQALDLLDVAVADHRVAAGTAIVVPEFEEVTA